MSTNLRKRLTSYDLVPGTFFWTCRIPECHAQFPARVIISNETKRTSKTAICPKCGTRRKMSDEERKLIEGDPNAVPPIPGVMGLIRKHAAQCSKRCDIPSQDIFSLAYLVACEAAMTFDPANEIQFTTYLKSRLQFECTAQKAIEEYRSIPSDQGSVNEVALLSLDYVDESSIRKPDQNAPDDAADTLREMLANADISERDRELLMMRFGHSASFADLAERFNLPLETMGDRIHGLLLRIRGKNSTSEGRKGAPHPKPLPSNKAIQMLINFGRRHNRKSRDC